MSTASEVPVRPAATIVLMRGDAPEVLLLLRHGQHGFMPNIWVFPGGRVEATDGEGDLGARRAAVRETREEAGVVLAEDTWLGELPRWVTPVGEKRRFDTRFFAACVPVDCCATADQSEVIDALWLTPAAALERHDEGKLALAPPTWWSLEILRRLGTVDAVRAWTDTTPVARIEPKLALEAGGVTVNAVDIAVPGEPVSGRLSLVKGVWRHA